jgi:hypothetical protein
MRLIHIVDTKVGLTSTTHRYVLQTGWADRPAEGIQTGRALSRVCGKWVTFRLCSRARARARRRREFATALVGVPVAVLLLMTLIRLDTADELSTGAALACLLGVGVFGATGSIATVMAAIEDGVVLTWKERRSGPHEVKPLHMSLALSRPKAIDDSERVEIVFDA